MPVDASIFNNAKSFQDYQLQDLQGALVAAQAKKAMTPDLDELGQRAYLKAANGMPLDATEQAALSYLDQKSQTWGFNPATGRLEQKPSLLQRIGQPQPAQPAAAVNPSGAFAQAMGGAPQAGSGDFLADMGAAPSGGINALSPKANQVLAEENIKSGRKRVDELVGAASSAGGAKQAAETMKALQPNLGYTGVGGSIAGFADKAFTALGMGNLISGTPQAREAFQTQGVDAWVKAVEPLKGALTEQEGARFDKAVSNLSTTPEGIRLRAEITSALANRAQEKAQFYESYLSQNGTLTGADAIWQQYSNENPIITDELLAGAGPKSGFEKSKAEFDKRNPSPKQVTREDFNNQQKLTPAEQEELNQLRARFAK